MTNRECYDWLHELAQDFDLGHNGMPTSGSYGAKARACADEVGKLRHAVEYLYRCHTIIGNIVPYLGPDEAAMARDAIVRLEAKLREYDPPLTKP